MNLNEKLLEAIESKGKRLEYDELSRTETDVQAAANECEAIAVEFAKGFADYIEHLLYTHNPIVNKPPDELITIYKQSLNK